MLTKKKLEAKIKRLKESLEEAYDKNDFSESRDLEIRIKELKEVLRG